MSTPRSIRLESSAGRTLYAECPRTVARIPTVVFLIVRVLQSRVGAIALIASLGLMAWGCSPDSPHPAVNHPVSSAAQTRARTQQHRTEGPGLGGAPAKLVRQMHFPSVSAGHCPASRGRISAHVGLVLGSGPVRVRIDDAGDLRHGRVHPARYSQGWLALKTHFVSLPSYQGPFLVRAGRLDNPGPIALGQTPSEAGPLVVPAGPAANESAGSREFPYPTFVRSPGCYAWQIDG